MEAWGPRFVFELRRDGIGWATYIREAGRASREGERAVAKIEET